MTLPLEDGPEAFLRAYGDAVRPLRTTHGDAYWRFTAHGETAAQDVLSELEGRLSDLHADPAVYARLQAWLPQTEGLVRRQLEVLIPDYRQAQVPEALRKEIIRLSLKIEETCTVYRAELGGRQISSNELDRLLLQETDDGLRRQAWEATRGVGARVAPKVRTLATLRNEQARHLGFRDYFALALDDEEMDADLLGALLDDLQARTDAPWARLKEKLDGEIATLRGKDPSELQPWDYTDRFLQSIPRSADGMSLDPWFRPQAISRFTRDYYRGVGLPVDALWEASDLMPRDGKYPHAYCIGIDNPSDVRVLCNLDTTARWMETALHEFGHAVYNAGIDPDLPFLLREPAHTFVTEAVAMFFGRLARDADWLQAVAKVPADRAEHAADGLAENQLVFARWALVVTRFEQAMYADPSADLDAIWWALVGELQGLRRPAGWGGGDWASKVHVACYPAYYQYYLLGELLASQLRASLSGRGVGSTVGVADVGAFFSQLFAQGQRHRWDVAVERLCGEPLTARHWVAEFGA
jgi:peptidyl-dipeptidase A